MAAVKLNLTALWTVVSILLILTDECKGQSSTGGVNIVAVIVSVVIIVIIICITMPICVICLTVALCCTCNKYRKTKNASEALEDGKEETTTQEGGHSMHNLPLPPIPNENTTSTVVQRNEAYGINSGLGPQTQDNEAYADSQQLYMYVDQREARSAANNFAQRPQERPLLQNENNVSMIQGIRNKAYGVKSEPDLLTESNEAYGTGATEQAESSEYVIADLGEESGEYVIADLGEESGEYVLVDGETESTKPTPIARTDENNIVKDRNQSAEGTEYNNYYDYI